MKLVPIITAAGIALFATAGAIAYSQTRQGAQDIEALRTYVMDFGGTERPFDNAF